MSENKRSIHLILGSMLPKLKHCAFFLILVLILLLFVTLNNIFLTMNYKEELHDEFQNVTISINKSFKNPEWFDIVARECINGEENVKIGLVNMDSTGMIGLTNGSHQNLEIVDVSFDPVGMEIKWSDINPPWLESFPRPKCPEIPMPTFEDYQELDVVVANVSQLGKCEAGGMRNISRLQLNLIVANLLVRNGSKKGNRPLFAVFIGSCEPMWDIFRCDDLVLHQGNYWIYRPDLRRLAHKTLMPIGICEYVPPFSRFGDELSWGKNSNTSKPREAYVTILHSSEAYVCGAITLAQSIIRTNSTKDLVLLVDKHISEKSLTALRAAGWKIKVIQRIRSSNAQKRAYNRWNYTKLRIWQLKEYDKVMFIDSDFIVKQNIDDFFIYPQLSAAPNYEKHIFNSGLMLVEPSDCTFDTLMKKRFNVTSYNGGDQGYLNEFFIWWHRLPEKLHFLKVFTRCLDKQHQLPDDVYTIHYMGIKPWKCRQQFDCNWGWAEFRQYASDSAHAEWLEVFYSMDKKLQPFCPVTHHRDTYIPDDLESRKVEPVVPITNISSSESLLL